MANTIRATANLILTGFMGTGKSTVGRILADRLRLPFVDTDAEIERRHGPVRTIFAELGEARFRELERELVADLSARPGPMVIATGGGMLVEPENAARLSATGPVYTLTAAPEEIIRRVGALPDERPLLAGVTPAPKVEALLRERAEAYGRWIQVSTDGRTAQVVADVIVEDATERGVVGPSPD